MSRQPLFASSVRKKMTPTHLLSLFLSCTSAQTQLDPNPNPNPNRLGGPRSARAVPRLRHVSVVGVFPKIIDRPKGRLQPIRHRVFSRLFSPPAKQIDAVVNVRVCKLPSGVFLCHHIEDSPRFPQETRPTNRPRGGRGGAVQ